MFGDHIGTTNLSSITFLLLIFARYSRVDKSLKIDKIIKILGDRVDNQFEYITTNLSLKERVVNPYHRFNDDILGDQQDPQQINFYTSNGFFNYSNNLTKNTLLEISVPAGYKLSQIKTDLRFVTYFILLNKPNKKNRLRYIYHTSIDQIFDLSGYLVEDYNNQLYSEIRVASTDAKKRLDIAFQHHSFQKNLSNAKPKKTTEVRTRYKEFFRDIITKKIKSNSAFSMSLEKINGTELDKEVKIFSAGKVFIPSHIFKICSSTYCGDFPFIHEDTFRDIFDEVSAEIAREKRGK